MFRYRLCDFIAPVAAVRRDGAKALADYGMAVDSEVRIAVGALLKALESLDGLKQQDFSSPTAALARQFRDEGSIYRGLDGFMKVFDAKSIFRPGGPLWPIRDEESLLLSERVQGVLRTVSQIRRYIWRRVEHLHKLSNPTPLEPTGILTEALDINALIEKAIQLESSRHNLDFRFCNVEVVAGGIPAFCADGIRILLGVREILRNAVFATRIVVDSLRREAVRHGQRVLIRTQLLTPQRFQISIEDNGIGIAPESLPKIRAFGYTASQGEVTFGGLGIGIPTAIASFEELGGEVIYDSNRDRGTTVALVIPIPE